MRFECTTSKIFHPFLLTLLLDVLFLVQLKNSAQFKLHALPLSFVLIRSWCNKELPNSNSNPPPKFPLKVWYVYIGFTIMLYCKFTHNKILDIPVVK